MAASPDEAGRDHATPRVRAIHTGISTVAIVGNASTDAM